MIKNNVLKKGDEVLSISDKFVSIKRKNGSVDIYNIYTNDEGEFYIDPIIAGTIDYGNGSIEKQLSDGETTIINF